MFNCSDKKLYNTLTNDQKLYHSETKLCASDNVATAVSSRTIGDIYEWDPCGCPGGKTVSPAGVMGYLDSILSGKRGESPCQEKESSKVLLDLDCYCIGTQSRRLLWETGCVKNKLYDLHENLIDNIKKHNALIHRKEVLQKKIISYEKTE